MKLSVYLALFTIAQTLQSFHLDLYLMLFDFFFRLQVSKRSTLLLYFPNVILL